jgi:Tetratricopeptide repeat
MPHLLAANLTDATNPDLRKLACDAIGYLVARGDARTAHGLASPLQEQWRELLGRDDTDTLSLALNVAWALREMGRYDDALQQDRDTLERRRRVLGENHPQTLRSAGHLAEDLRLMAQAGAGS